MSRGCNLASFGSAAQKGVKKSIDCASSFLVDSQYNSYPVSCIYWYVGARPAEVDMKTQAELALPRQKQRLNRCIAVLGLTPLFLCVKGASSSGHNISQEGNLAESDVAPAQSDAVERTADALSHKQQVESIPSILSLLFSCYSLAHKRPSLHCLRLS